MSSDKKMSKQYTENTAAILVATKEFGLKLKDEKTKTCSCLANRMQDQPTAKANKSSENMVDFMYLGRTQRNENYFQKEL